MKLTKSLFLTSLNCFCKLWFSSRRELPEATQDALTTNKPLVEAGFLFKGTTSNILVNYQTFQKEGIVWILQGIKRLV
jgi:hypothetical protein